MDHKRKKKVSKDKEVVAIIAMRDELKKNPDIAEKADMACKGMYRCSKTADADCLDRIKSDLSKLKSSDKPEKAAAKKKGGRAKSRSRSKSRSKSKR